jgi:hypothetical protein
MQITQGITLDNYQYDRTIVTLEEATTVKPSDGEEYTVGKGSSIKINGGIVPPQISSPNGKGHIDIVLVISH